MAGVVLETLSNKKLFILGGLLLLAQIIFFIIGGIIAPKPFNVEVILSTNCIDKGVHTKDQFFFSRDDNGDNEKGCERVHDLQDPSVEDAGITANQVVFTFQFPTPRDGRSRDMSRYFQQIISVLEIHIVHRKDVVFENGATLTMDVRLGYRDKGDNLTDWKEIVRSTEERALECTLNKMEQDYPYECDILPFFELGSCHHDYYLVNIRLPVHELKEMNLNVGSIKEFTLVAIHQTGGFTKVWLSMKTITFPILMGTLVWFWRRIAAQERTPMLLEKTLFALALTLSFLNFPIEWLTLVFNMPFMLMLSDIRQGIFYAMLLCFWIIFAGEHLMDQAEKNRLVIYWRHLSTVIFGCCCLFIFELCEKGVQMTNPFYSIWLTSTGRNLALGFIILACIAACCYFLFLCYMIFNVFRNISAKKSALPSMSKARRNYYTGLIYRFKFLMLCTLVCAALTVIFFIISEVGEGKWKWGDGEPTQIEYSSAFFTGVYGMWNLYVFALLILYAPSGKYMPVLNTDTSVDGEDEVVEFTNVPSEAVSLKTFTQKAAAD